ncbi:MAG: T9SS type A sorting domain-containing protein [Flavobacteriales bacterium]|nr:T9SS type A sorting domain-containing protein [Flavobacteriales bacterium]
MKTFCTAALFLCFTSLAVAQCTPDLSITAPGAYPENLSDGCVNANYSQQLDLVFPNDTTVNTPFGSFTTNIDSFLITVSGLPAGLSHECPTTSCTIIGVPGQLIRTCMFINGLPTTATVANNTFALDIEYWITIFGSPQSLPDSKTVGLTINDEVNVAVVNTGSVLTAQSGSGTFEWIDCDNGFASITGETSASFEPAVSGNYAVAVTVGECVALSECFAVTAAGVNDINPFNFQIFPIPAHDQLTLAIPDFKETFALTLVDATGRVVYQATISTAKTTIDLSALSKGIYTVQLAQNGVVSVQKLVMD